MTIQELITKVKEEKPNTFETAKYIEFINEVESTVCDVIRREFEPYTIDDLAEDLIVPAPHSRLYVSYVKAMIDYANEEYASYQLNQEQYNIDFAEFENWVVRTGFDRDSDYVYVPARFKNLW